MSHRIGRSVTTGQLQEWSTDEELQGILRSESIDEVRALYFKLLNEGMHGICFSMYEDGQKPGDIISEEQVRRRMGILRPHVKAVRSFSCIEGNEYIPIVAMEFGMKTLVGAWLGDEEEKNRTEIDALIDLARRGYVDVAAVGNEAMYRKDLTEDRLLEYIYEVKEALPDIPVGYVDAYYEFSNRPRITEACDLILTNCYPFWEGCPFEYSLHHMNAMYHEALAAGQGKQVIITETGWPSQGENFEGSYPSNINAMKYFIQTQLWCRSMGVESYYFASFDESWKVGSEGDVGAYWGLWDKHENLKYTVESIS